jgi:hypothetical protein
MDRHVTLEQLEDGTLFKLGGVTYMTTGSYESGNKRVCVPKYGGQLQRKLQESLPRTTQVVVES